MCSSTSVFQITFQNTCRIIFFHIRIRCNMVECKLYILIRWLFKLFNYLLNIICLNSTGTKYLRLFLVIKACKCLSRFFCNLIFFKFIHRFIRKITCDCLILLHNCLAHIHNTSKLLN